VVPFTTSVVVGVRSEPKPVRITNWAGVPAIVYNPLDAVVLVKVLVAVSVGWAQVAFTSA